MVDERAARALWHRFEPIHAVVYFAPEVREALEEAGLKGYWMTYFAGRAAPMGPVPAEVVEATFFNFSPARVRRALPDAWALLAPDEVIAVRRAAVGRVLHRVLGEAADDDAIATTAATLRRVAESADLSGRPLAAAYASLPWPEDPLVALWHATCVLREQRGDGHVAALTAAGLSGVEAHVSLTLTSDVPAELLQQSRGWTDEEWAAAQASLTERGWLDEHGSPTDEGRRARQAVERTTDELAARPWTALGDDELDEVTAHLETLRRLVVASDVVAFPNPMGLPKG